MAKKGDDQGHVEELRNEIRTLQSEYAKKKEEFERQQRKRKDAQTELNDKQDRLQVMTNDLATLDHKSQRASAEGHDESESAKHKYMQDQVGNLLKARIPIMRTIEEHAAEAGAGHNDVKDRQPEDQQKNAVHDTVLVSYVMLGSDDYLVAYRIDDETTVEQLHRDACSYWGCSHNEFCLCKINTKEEAEPLWVHAEDDARKQKLQSVNVLDPAEKAQLHLVRWDDLRAFKEQRQKVKGQEQKQDTQAKDKSSDPNSIKTLKHGHGYAVQEAITEPFIESLRPWPGIHNLMKTSTSRRDHQRWHHTRLSDVVLFAFLIVVSSLCFVFRTLPNEFMLKAGAVDFLANGVGTEWTGESIIKFEDIRRYEDIWAWLRVPFRHQLYNDSSMLRQFYKPVGYMRLRQQKAKQKECPERNLPANLAQTCHYVYVDDQTQDTSTYEPKQADSPFTNASGTEGREPAPNPLVWQPSDVPAFHTYGLLQQSYGGSGFMIVYNLSASTGIRFSEDLKFISEAWIAPQTRMFAVELTLANYNLGGYVSATFLFEISPSGAISPNLDVMPFTLYSSWGKVAADWLDVVRGILVIGYVAVIRFFLRTKELMSSGKGRFSYLCTLSGILDSMLVGLFIGLQYMRFEDSPPKPETLNAFYSYSWYAHRSELLSVLEGLLILTLLVMFVALARMTPIVYRFFKLFGRAAWMFLYFSLVFLPIFLGTCFLANTIWSPYIFGFSTWMETYLTTLLGMNQPFADIMEMHQQGGGWTIPFLLYFALSLSAFMIYMLMAIMVYSYFEVELVEGSVPKHEQWSRDQWLDWALWAPVYSKLTGKKAGSSRIAGYAEADEKDDDEDSEGDSDEEK